MFQPTAQEGYVRRVRGALAALPRRYTASLLLAVTLLVGFMSLLDVTIVNVAIPSMRSGLDTTAGTVQWVVSGYALAFGLTVALWVLPGVAALPDKA